jgi:hypothetical protein
LKLDLSKEVETGYPPGMKNIGLPYDPPSDVIGADSAQPMIDQPRTFGTHERYLVAHGALLALGFLVLLPAGSLAARWGRTLTPAWFSVHQMSNYYLALPIILAGWLLGPIAVFNADSSHFSDSHKVIISYSPLCNKYPDVALVDMRIIDDIPILLPSQLGTIHTCEEGGCS